MWRILVSSSYLQGTGSQRRDNETNASSRNPPTDVAQCFLELLQEKEFQGGWWEEVAFAVLDNTKGPNSGKDGNGNFGQFYKVLNGQVV
jgi:hypothetical protein